MLLVCYLLLFSNVVSTSPKKDGKGKVKDKFKDFQENTIDAWDVGDDDLLAMNPQVVQSTALQVECNINSEFVTSSCHQVLA